jgi:hypothetical protein
MTGAPESSRAGFDLDELPNHAYLRVMKGSKHATEAARLRLRAAQCDTACRDPSLTGNQQERLWKMRDAYLALADEEEWLSGTAALGLTAAELVPGEDADGRHLT